MGVYKLSASGGLKTGRTTYASMLAGNPVFNPTSIDLIATTTLSSTQSIVTLDFAGLSSTYKHLQIRISARANTSGGAERMRIRINNEAVSEPRYIMGGDSSTAFGGNGSLGTDSSVISDRLAASYSRSAEYTPLIIDIPDAFSTNRYKTLKIFTGNPTTYSGEKQVSLQTVLYTDLQALSTLSFSTGNTGWNQQSFVSGSRFSLYGIKG